jgi:hypothetical protein
MSCSETSIFVNWLMLAGSAISLFELFPQWINMHFAHPARALPLDMIAKLVGRSYVF